MTVGIAALAEAGRAIVLCADRQRTAGDIRHEGRIAKKREIGYGWRFLYEENGTRADELRDEVMDALQQDAISGPPMGATQLVMSERLMFRHFHPAFLRLRERTLKSGTLPPNEDFDLGVLLVGFDENNDATGITIFPSGDYETIREVGYGAVGSGADVAEATLAHYGVTYDDSLDHVLWKVYESKRRADKLVTSVGMATDLWIMADYEQRQTFREPPDVRKGQPAAPVQVPPRILGTLGEVFDWISSPPWARKSEPIVWSSTLARYAQEVMAGRSPE